eukprot:759111-Hanusia_phi.AAC.2
MARERTLKEVVKEGLYVLYWMSAAQRTRDNHALQQAISISNHMQKPLWVVFCLFERYPEANERLGVRCDVALS